MKFKKKLDILTISFLYDESLYFYPLFCIIASTNYHIDNKLLHSIVIEVRPLIYYQPLQHGHFDVIDVADIAQMFLQMQEQVVVIGILDQDYLEMINCSHQNNMMRSLVQLS